MAKQVHVPGRRSRISSVTMAFHRPVWQTTGFALRFELPSRRVLLRRHRVTSETQGRALIVVQPARRASRQSARRSFSLSSITGWRISTRRRWLPASRMPERRPNGSPAATVANLILPALRTLTGSGCRYLVRTPVGLRKLQQSRDRIRSRFSKVSTFLTATIVQVSPIRLWRASDPSPANRSVPLTHNAVDLHIIKEAMSASSRTPSISVPDLPALFPVSKT
ncbi:Hypothetical protein NGAL_HAMBI1146_19060 [Neorhizobium galegae bv. officinalis]|nr:Hypothetical protein NGAL_HAMBI1146_19060 [Neorhizobium galegae bv. officinalis]